MKTILVMSTALDKSIEHTQWGQPLGLAYIAACIRDISDVVIIDCEVDEQYTKTLMREINTDDTLIVGFSANTYTYPKALRLAKMVKEHNPNAYINFGGYHATPLADVILKNREYIDSIIRGDGEIPFRELINALLNGTGLSKVGSLTFRNRGRIVSNPDAPLPELDSLPYPARDLLQMEKCFNNFKSCAFHNDYEISRMVYVGANRGCPHYCNFCSIFNKKWRARDPTNIVDEFEYVKKMYDADSVYLVGDNLNLDSKWFSMLCHEIIRRDLDMKWISMTMNPLAINRQVVMDMVDSGCIRIACGFESGSQKMIYSLNKEVSVNTFKSTVERLNNTNIDIAASFILGAPGESETSLDKTRNFLKESRFETSSACILTPLPGSEIFAKMINVMPKLRELDIIKLEDLRKKYVENFCDIDYQRLIEIREEFSSLSKYNLNLYNI